MKCKTIYQYINLKRDMIKRISVMRICFCKQTRQPILQAEETAHTDFIMPLLKYDYQGCHSHKISKFPDFSQTSFHFSLNNQTYKIKTCMYYYDFIPY